MIRQNYILQETQWKQIKDGKWEVAVLPWGATEPHNYHLPYGTDTLETDYIASESARIACKKGAKIMILPTIPFGVNTGQIDIPFCINMNPGTQFEVLKDVIESLVNQGIKKLLVLNGHGGNEFKGKKFLNDLTEKIASYLVELDKADPDNLYDDN